MSKKYKAIFFDWDGTAVMSRQAPVEEAVAAMKPLLASGVKLVIVSGTTYDKIASGKIHEHFTPEEASNLYLGLGRGAYNYKSTESYLKNITSKLMLYFQDQTTARLIYR